MDVSGAAAGAGDGPASAVSCGEALACGAASFTVGLARLESEWGEVWVSECQGDDEGKSVDCIAHDESVCSLAQTKLLQDTG